MILFMISDEEKVRYAIIFIQLSRFDEIFASKMCLKKYKEMRNFFLIFRTVPTNKL